MEIKKLDKDLIFYIPGKPGAVFTYSAGYALDDNLLGQTVENLELLRSMLARVVEHQPVRPHVICDPHLVLGSRS